MALPDVLVRHSPLAEPGRTIKAKHEPLAIAEMLIREAVRLAPRCAPYHVYLAMHLWRRHDMIGAWESFQTALRLDPSYLTGVRSAAWFLSEWHLQTSALSHDMGAVTLAGNLFQQAARLDPRDVTTLIAYAKFLDEVKQDRPAAAAMRKHVEQLQSQADVPLMAVADDRDGDDDDE